MSSGWDANKGSRKNKLAFWRERPAGLRLPRPANHCGLPVMIQLGMGAAAKCQIILARALSVLVVLACLARMCGMPTDNSYAGEMPQSDRVKGDRSSQDNAAHPPPDYSSCLPPRKGAIRRDPTYGRTIKRLTDSTKPGPGKPQSMTAEYATQNHFNA